MAVELHCPVDPSRPCPVRALLDQFWASHAREHELLDEARVETREALEAHVLSKIDAWVEVSDSRFRALERLVFIGVGASTVIAGLVHFVK